MLRSKLSGPILLGANNGRALRDSVSTPEGKFSDLTINLNDRVYKCHKPYIAQSCRNFETMIYGMDLGNLGTMEFGDLNNNTITLQNIPTRCFESFLDFVYLRQVEFPKTLKIWELCERYCELLSFSLDYGIGDLSNMLLRNFKKTLLLCKKYIVYFLNCLLARLPLLDKNYGTELLKTLHIVTNDHPSPLLIRSNIIGCSLDTIHYIISARSSIFKVWDTPSWVHLYYENDMALYIFSTWFWNQLSMSIQALKGINFESDDYKVLPLEVLISEVRNLEGETQGEVVTDLIRQGREIFSAYLQEAVQNLWFTGQIRVPRDFILIFSPSSGVGYETDSFKIFTLDSEIVVCRNFKGFFIEKNLESSLFSLPNQLKIFAGGIEKEKSKIKSSLEYGHILGKLDLDKQDYYNALLSTPSLSMGASLLYMDEVKWHLPEKKRYSEHPPIPYLYPPIRKNTDALFLLNILPQPDEGPLSDITLPFLKFSLVLEEASFITPGVDKPLLCPVEPTTKDLVNLQSKPYLDFSSIKNNPINLAHFPNTLSRLKWIWIYIKQLDEKRQGIIFLGVLDHKDSPFGSGEEAMNMTVGSAIETFSTTINDDQFFILNEAFPNEQNNSEPWRMVIPNQIVLSFVTYGFAPVICAFIERTFTFTQ